MNVKIKTDFRAAVFPIYSVTQLSGNGLGYLTEAGDVCLRNEKKKAMALA